MIAAAAAPQLADVARIPMQPASRRRRTRTSAAEQSVPPESRHSLRERTCSRGARGDGAPSPGARGDDASQPQRRTWKPGVKDRLAFQWIKFDGLAQHWVAEQLGVHQGTVSRMVQRYERWLAHAAPGEVELEHAERLRAQRWLTYQRNERIIAASLRIADEMERNTNLSKTVRLSPANHPSHEHKIRQENTSVDRSGVACRFLRLAFRVNMEQLKLAEMEPLPVLEPLDAQEVDERFERAEREQEEMYVEFRRQQQEQYQESGDRSQESGDGSQESGDRSQESGERSQESSLWSARSASGSDETDATSPDVLNGQAAHGSSACGASGPREVATAHGAHKAHNAHGPESAASLLPPVPCALDGPAEKNPTAAHAASAPGCVTANYGRL